ncbi:family 43 glycosylhydrolase [uncultured Microbacterium sp.]|uniref:family 43 glycosylhydrolase n=1 Tax=uncultured Microbacterium sp. TaxID=191216 RepID=UPI0025D683DA|nr:family 43 glycosylhydrolase [uncultured Microbacterium sp.]
MTRTRTLLALGVVGVLAATASGTPAIAAPVRTAAASAEAPPPVAFFDFDAPPVDGAFASGSARATVRGRADLVAGREGHGTAARLSSQFWLDVRNTDGSAVLAGDDEVTLSYDSMPAASDNTGWTVFVAADAAAPTYGNERYLGILDRTGGMTVERYRNSGGRDASGNLSAEGRAGWKHVDLVLSGNTARLYIDQKLVRTALDGPALDEILGSSGGVLQVGKANWGAGEYFSGLIDDLKIYDRALTPDQLGVAGAARDDRAALGIPSVVLGDLPTEVLGKSVSWTATGPGAARVLPDGHVDTAGLGEAGVAVRLRAQVDGAAEPFSWDVTLRAPGGEIATYVKTVTTTGGVKDDPLAYDDDRRADSLYVAARSAGTPQWQPLNRGQAVLSVLWDDSQAAKPWAQMGSPSLFRDADGHLGVVASQNDSTSRIYLWRSTDDHTFTDQQVIDLGAGIVSTPRVGATPEGGYQVRWTDLSTGEGRAATLSTLDSSATVSAPTRADARTLDRSGDGLPSWASEVTATAVTIDQFDAFVNAYVDLQNTGVDAISAQVATGADAAAVRGALPRTATLRYNDGSAKRLPVQWDAQQAADAAAKGPGTYEIQGVVQQHAQRLVSDARADPHVFYNDDDGFYYLTGSHYGEPSDGRIDEASSYRKIGLKRASTLDGLASAPEQIVIDPDDGTVGHEGQYPNTFFGWGGFIWAQEFHKINGRWWIVAGMNRGFAQTGGWCDNTVLIPYTGDSASIAGGGFFDEKNWGEPVVLEGAAFDVSYFERVEDGRTQGYWIMPNSGRLLVGKARGGEGAVPLLDGPLSTVYETSQVWERGKQAPTPSDTTEGQDQAVVEAPFMISHGGRVYLTYSGGTVDKYYDLGLLTADADAVLTDPASWRQTAFPVLDTNDTFQGRLGADERSSTARTAGTGHNSFIEDAEGNLLLAYHARPYPDPHTATDPGGAGGLFDPDRNTWFQSVNVRADGRLDLTLTKDQEVAPAYRTVNARITIAAGGTSPTEPPTGPDPQPTGTVPTSPSATMPPASVSSPSSTPDAAPARFASLSVSAVERGGVVRVNVIGLLAGEKVTAELHSEPLRIAGIPAADEKGRAAFDVRIPPTFSTGRHQIVLRAADGTEFARLPITVAAQGTLAATGAQAPLGAALLGAMSVVAGAALWAKRRSRWGAQGRNPERP